MRRFPFSFRCTQPSLTWACEILGTIADAYRSGEAFPIQARQVPGLGSTCSQHGDEGLRFARCTGSGIYLLASSVHRPRSSKGIELLRQFLPLLPLIPGIVCRPRTSTADIVASHYRCSCTSQRANRRSVQSRKRLSKTSRDIHRPGTNRRRINATQRSRVSYLSLFACRQNKTERLDSIALPIRQRPHFKRSRRDKSRKICSTSTTSHRREQPTGLAATQVLQQPAAKNIMSGTSTNPLDDLVSIFGNTSLSPSVPAQTAPLSAGVPALDPFAGLGGASPASASVSNQQEDLLGLF